MSTAPAAVNRRRPIAMAIGGVLGFLRRELTDLLRQRTLLLLTVLGPFLILFAFGAGYRDERLVLRTLFVGPQEQGFDELVADNSERVEEFIDTQGYSSDLFAARDALADGEIDAVVVFPLDPMADVLAGNRSQVTVIHDQLNPIQRVAVEFAVRLATNEVNQAVVEQLLLRAQTEAEPYRETLATISEGREQLDAVDADDRAVLEDLSTAIDRLQGQTATVEQFWTTYGGGQDELGVLRTRLDETSTQLDELQEANRSLTDEEIEQLGGQLDDIEQQAALLGEVDPAVLARPFQSTTETLSTTTIDQIDFFGAAATALLLQHLTMSLGALTFVRDRAMGLFELIRVGPVGPGEVITGKLVAFVLVGAVVAAALVAALALLLGVPMLGSLVWLSVVIGLLLLASVGLGFCLSLVARSDTQAVQYAMLALLASLFFSGFFIDHERFERVVSAPARLLPVTSAISGLQDVMLRGQAPEPIDVAVLGSLAVGSLALAWVLLRRQLRTS